MRKGRCQSPPWLLRRSLKYEDLYLSELLGVVVIFVGFLVSREVIALRYRHSLLNAPDAGPLG